MRKFSYRYEYFSRKSENNPSPEHADKGIMWNSNGLLFLIKKVFLGCTGIDASIFKIT